MLTSILLAAAFWPSAVTEYCQTSERTIMLGVAKSSSGKFLYCEEVEQKSQHSLTIKYINNGEIFAEKTVSYIDNPATPSIHQNDFRFGEIRKADIDPPNIKLLYQASSQKKNEEITVPLTEIDVVDAGFDYFIRQHWDELQSGKTVSVNFASIPHQKVLPLRVKSQAPTKCASKNEPAVANFCFLVEVDNSVLRLILGNIKLTYDQQHRLVTFNGVVNIEDEKQSAQSAKINYYYQSDYLEQ